ncbi:FKBP-type peptidyl-prolyl cis-trans isomerase [Methanospirillum lacunae]|uniref:Peptidyl-prolyl cis-trans isomerase n=1 Tax=Methanospirillum lacunae TaxID=668570 RepID=A0A2V2MYI8_9EURY|nr:peptidylprolyl isomerase [Methanospirillum lacunae]PWR73194.1 peptidylprolyl isomerase [Methanospirillum lacunae]
MPVKEGDFIKLSYTGRSFGMVFDTTSETEARESGAFDEKKKYEPVIVCAGKQQILLGLDEAVMGKEPGDEGTIEIPPEKAFGEREQELMRSYEKKVFNEKPSVGMRVNIPNTGEGTVVKMIGNRVLVDFNHPLAGQTLDYSYKIEGFVEDPAEQIKGLISIFSGLETSVSIENGVAKVDLPAGIYSYSRRFVSSKPYITISIFDLVNGIEEIQYIEKYPKPEKKAEEIKE